MNTKVKKQSIITRLKSKHGTLKKAAYSDLVVNLLLIILGLIYIAIPELIQPYFGLIILIYVAFRIINSTLLLVIKTDRLRIASLIISVLVLISLIIMAIFNTADSYKLFGIIIIIAWCFDVIYDIQNLIVNIKEKRNILVFDIITTAIDITFVIAILVLYQSDVITHILLYGFFYVLEGLAGIVVALIYKRKRNKGSLATFYKVIRKTYVVEIFLGLTLGIVIASLILPKLNEPQIPSFVDALWYCFELVTTIGFGDIVCVTAGGRIISVILGIYGIVIVALITSVIVNLYSEKRLKEINEQEKRKNIEEAKNHQDIEPKVIVKTVEVIKEVPVEVIKEVPVEVIKEIKNEEPNLVIKQDLTEDDQNKTIDDKAKEIISILANQYKK